MNFLNPEREDAIIRAAVRRNLERNYDHLWPDGVPRSPNELPICEVGDGRCTNNTPKHATYAMYKELTTTDEVPMLVCEEHAYEVEWDFPRAIRPLPYWPHP